jgi:hypothetical protein
METGDCGAPFLYAPRRVGVAKKLELGHAIIPNQVFLADNVRDLTLKRLSATMSHVWVRNKDGVEN